ncbi:hypothetical protein D9C73_022641 [Collichthys lucidus]|uniref:Uncharacterized protein n=1 Tax=Collichthys lucidus TaxID=240159 RepID=A0A4U5VKR5_COLLU|nr:hypothetical protein D9C73_022641 [Collichthys lucidus]
MSRRRSTGDLVPRDVTEILAREAKVQRGQKKSGSSLGQAFSWLKGSRKKKNVANGLSRTGIGVTDAKLGLQNHEPAKAACSPCLAGPDDDKAPEEFIWSKVTFGTIYVLMVWALQRLF